MRVWGFAKRSGRGIVAVCGKRAGCVYALAKGRLLLLWHRVRRAPSTMNAAHCVRTQGAGNFGAVLLGVSNVDDQQYAIKLIECRTEEELAKIKQEAKVTPHHCSWGPDGGGGGAAHCHSSRRTRWRRAACKAQSGPAPGAHAHTRREGSGVCMWRPPCGRPGNCAGARAGPAQRSWAVCSGGPHRATALLWCAGCCANSLRLVVPCAPCYRAVCRSCCPCPTQTS